MTIIKKNLRAINSGEGVETREPCYTVVQNISWCSQYDVLKIELPYDSTIPLLGIYIEKAIIQKDICALLLIAALFTVAKLWKQPKLALIFFSFRVIYRASYMSGSLAEAEKSEMNDAHCKSTKYGPWLRTDRVGIGGPGDLI